jgi:cell wall-associated NlpC family hydrolase
MAQIRASRPSPAMIVAVVALGAAVTGTAVAEVATTAKLDKKEKKQVRKIARKQINKLASGLSVASANTANTANSAETANSANTANTANTANSANSANTANTAAQAQNAATANGVRPVKVNFAAAANTPERTFLNQGGARFEGECNSAGNAIFRTVATANNGVVKLDAVNGVGGTNAIVDKDLDVTGAVGLGTGAAPNDVRSVTVTYGGAGGTEVSGNVVLAEGAAAAQCVIAGTLFVG